MRFFITMLAVFAATAAAAPVAAPAAKPKPLDILGDIKNGAEDALNKLNANGCDTAKCVIALAPAVISCSVAAASEGLNPAADAACLATAANDAVNKPEACTACF